VYPYLNNGNSYVSGSNQEYTTRLNKINPTLDKAKEVYKGTQKHIDNPDYTITLGPLEGIAKD
jgi:hypothetical protein